MNARPSSPPPSHALPQRTGWVIVGHEAWWQGWKLQDGIWMVVFGPDQRPALRAPALEDATPLMAAIEAGALRARELPAQITHVQQEAWVRGVLAFRLQPDPTPGIPRKRGRPPKIKPSG